jgi:hypothetical protein
LKWEDYQKQATIPIQCGFASVGPPQDTLGLKSFVRVVDATVLAKNHNRPRISSEHELETSLKTLRPRRQEN